MPLRDAGYLYLIEPGILETKKRQHEPQAPLAGKDKTIDSS